MWYSSLVGCIVPLLKIEETEYKSVQPAGWVNFVLKEDAETIEVDIEKVYMYDRYVPNS